MGMELVKTIAVQSPTPAQKPSVPVLPCQVAHGMDSTCSSSLIPFSILAKLPFHSSPNGCSFFFTVPMLLWSVQMVTPALPLGKSKLPDFQGTV